MKISNHRRCKRKLTIFEKSNGHFEGWHLLNLVAMNEWRNNLKSLWPIFCEGNDEAELLKFFRKLDAKEKAAFLADLENKKQLTNNLSLDC